MCIMFVYTLLKLVCYYDLNVLSMSVMGFQKKTLDGGWGELYPVLFVIFLTLQSPLVITNIQHYIRSKPST